MKKLLASLIIFTSFSASASVVTDFAITLFKQTATENARILGLNWKVGQTANYDLDAGFISGTMVMRVREEVAEGFWLEQNVNLSMGGAQKIEVLFDKNTGQILKMIVNGEEKDPPDASNIEVIDMREDTVTVPAGTFDCVYLKVRDNERNAETEQWANPEKVPMSGLIKTVAPSPLGKVVVELTSFQF